MYCGENDETTFVNGAMWRPASYYYAGRDTSVVEYATLSDVGSDAGSAPIFARACKAKLNQLEFVYDAPPDCNLELHLLFADPATPSGARIMNVNVNGRQLAAKYDVGAVNAAGDVMTVRHLADEHGLVHVVISQDAASELAPIVSGFQVYAVDTCPSAGALSVQSTTGHHVEADSEGELIYRMACLPLNATRVNIPASLEASRAVFRDEAAMYLTATGAVKPPGTLSSVCMPRRDSTGVVLDIPVPQGLTSKVVLYFGMQTGDDSNSWADVIVTVDGQSVFTEDRNVFAPGPGDRPEYMKKSFDVYSEGESVSLMVSALGGFPLITGVEVYRLQETESSANPLPEVPNGRLVIECGSRVFLRTPAGEVLRPGTLAFQAAQLRSNVSAARAGAITASAPEYQDYVDAGAFHTECWSEDDLVANFAVQEGEEYKFQFLFAELRYKSNGARAINVYIDDKLMNEEPIDIYARAGFATTFDFRTSAIASGELMTVRLSATTGEAKLNALIVEGPGIDAKAADAPAQLPSSGILLTAACGSAGQQWGNIDEFAAAGFKRFTYQGVIAGAGRFPPDLYATHCYAQPAGGSKGSINLQFDVVPGAKLTVTMHFAETYFQEAGKRTFDIVINGVTRAPAFDIFVAAGFLTAHTRSFDVVPSGPTLTIELVSIENNALLNAIEVRGGAAVGPSDTPGLPNGTCSLPASDGTEGAVTVSPKAVAFGEIDPSSPTGNFQGIAITNTGAQVPITAVSCEPVTQGVAMTGFIIEFAPGNRAACAGAGVKTEVTPFSLPGAGAQRSVLGIFEPKAEEPSAALVTFWNGASALSTVIMQGVGGDPFSKPHTLHPVVFGSSVFPLSGTATRAAVTLDATTSHTHAPDRSLTTFVWEDVASGLTLGKGEVLDCSFPVGTHTVSMTITDTAGESLATTHTFSVAPDSATPGTLTQYYQGAAVPAEVPALPTFAALSPKAFQVSGVEMPFDGKFVLRLTGSIFYGGNPAGGPATFEFMGLPPAAAVYLEVDGVYQASASLPMSIGDHVIDVRMALTERTDVIVMLDKVPIATSVSDLSAAPPIINQVNTGAIAVSGSNGVISGFLLGDASISIDGTPASIITQSQNEIAFTYPELAPGKHELVATRNGLQSNVITVTVEEQIEQETGSLGGPFGSQPKFAQKTVDFDKPSRVVFCHGKAYVSHGYEGTIKEFTFNSNYNVVSERVLVKVPRPQSSVLGLACDYRDNDASFKLYFTHSWIFSQEGKEPTKAAPYVGSVSYIQPNSATPSKITTIIENISVANGDHTVNCLGFANEGPLLVCIGSQTNAGMPGVLGYLPENPTSAAIMEAYINKPGFDGRIQYEWLPSAPASIKANDPMDQRYGEWVRRVPNEFIDFYAYGTRNPFGLLVAQTGEVHVTINGPNEPYGRALTGYDAASDKATTANDPEGNDGLYIDLQRDCYCGSPNIARCRAGATRECSFVHMDTGSGQQFCKPTRTLPSAIGGPMQYNSYAFGGAYYGELFIPSYKKNMVRYNIQRNAYITDKQDPNYPNSPGIDAAHGPGGVHLVASFEKNKLLINYPVDPTVVNGGNPSLYDIVPNKALQTQSGPNTFVIGGENLGKITGEVTVLFGGVPATNVQVSGAKWITGHIPSNPAGSCTTSVSVKFGTTTLTLPEVFCYLAS